MVGPFLKKAFFVVLGESDESTTSWATSRLQQHGKSTKMSRKKRGMSGISASFVLFHRYRLELDFRSNIQHYVQHEHKQCTRRTVSRLAADLQTLHVRQGTFCAQDHNGHLVCTRYF